MNFKSKSMIGLSAALPIETRPLLDLLPEIQVCSSGKLRIYKSSYKSMPIVIVETGIGRERTERAVEYLFENFNIRWQIGFGLAGAIAPQLRSGAVVSPDRISRAPRIEDFIPLDPIGGIEKWSGELICGGLAVETDKPFYTKDKKAVAKSGAVMVDMESYATASIAKRYNTPVSMARVILDEAGYDLEPIISKEKQRPDYRNFMDMAKTSARKNANFLLYALDKILENHSAS